MTTADKVVALAVVVALSGGGGFFAGNVVGVKAGMRSAADARTICGQWAERCKARGGYPDVFTGVSCSVNGPSVPIEVE